MNEIEIAIEKDISHQYSDAVYHYINSIGNAPKLVTDMVFNINSLKINQNYKCKIVKQW